MVYTFNDGDSLVTVRETDFDYFSKQWYQKGMNTGEAFWIEPFSEQVEGAVNYNEPIPQSDQLDDIGYLQNSFAAMQQALREHMG